MGRKNKRSFLFGEIYNNTFLVLKLFCKNRPIWGNLPPLMEDRITKWSNLPPLGGKWVPKWTPKNGAQDIRIVSPKIRIQGAQNLAKSARNKPLISIDFGQMDHII